MIRLTQALVDAWAALERSEEHTKRDLGGVLFRDRIAAAARIAVAAFAGDLIEIGAYAGDTTIRLAAVAREAAPRRRVIAIDNWIPGTAYHLEDTERAYYRTVAAFVDTVDTWKVDAHSPETVARILRCEFAFALSDDGHLFEHHLSELRALMPVTRGIIAVDDVYYVPDVPAAIEQAVKEFPEWEALYGEGLRECYLVRRGN